MQNVASRLKVNFTSRKLLGRIDLKELIKENMGYQIYKVRQRWGGYGVPTICEHPDCNEEIDRGMSFACGGEPFSEYGCDRYFCGNHLVLHGFNVGGGREYKQVCERCDKRKSPFPYKSEHPTWVKHLLKDKSWEEWRKGNPDEVKRFTLFLQEEKAEQEPKPKT